MPKVPTLKPTWSGFKQKWSECSACPLCKTRRNLVLARGKIPCDVLFIGEAPGPSEDDIGAPFVGPAGKLLDKQIKEALENAGNEELRICFTNLVCCIPRSAPGQKFKEPSKESIEACAPRLDEFMCLAKADLTVAVGDLANKHLRELADVNITHPAAILRAEIVRQELMYTKVVVILENAFRDLIPF